MGAWMVRMQQLHAGCKWAPALVDPATWLGMVRTGAGVRTAAFPTKTRILIITPLRYWRFTKYYVAALVLAQFEAWCVRQLFLHFLPNLEAGSSGHRP